jgi:hypothetical protein
MKTSEKKRMGKKKKTPQAAEEAVALGTVQCRGSSRGFYDMNGYYFSLSLFHTIF